MDNEETKNNAVDKTPEAKPKAKAKAKPKAKAKAKPKAKAKAKPKGSDGAPRKSTIYSPSAKLTEKMVEELGNQAQIVAKALMQKGSATLSELASAVEKKLTTKQDPKNVVSFYLVQFKHDGLVKRGGLVKRAA